MTVLLLSLSLGRARPGGRFSGVHEWPVLRCPPRDHPDGVVPAGDPIPYVDMRPWYIKVVSWLGRQTGRIVSVIKAPS